ncbi:hypothetical protein BDR03DRAFT_948355 [Suillus americanus]|nr:hypothetical protein BDR03DRAFT_948355 [Suillus americanus]
MTPVRDMHSKHRRNKIPSTLVTGHIFRKARPSPRYSHLSQRRGQPGALFHTPRVCSSRQCHPVLVRAGEVWTHVVHDDSPLMTD